VHRRGDRSIERFPRRLAFVPPRQDLRPFLGTPVSVWVDDANGPRWRFVLDAALGRTAVMRPADDAARAFAARLQPGWRINLGAGDVDGFVQAEVMVDRYSAPQRMLLVSVPEKPKFLQRRSVFRVTVQVPVEVLAWSDGTLHKATGKSVNLSIDGIAAGLVIPAERHDQVVVLLRLPEGAIVVAGHVLDAGDRSGAPARLHLKQVGPTERRTLSGFLRRAEVERARLTRVRSA
jgi:hypothetical protein